MGNRNSIGTFISGAVFGALVGATVALITTPKSGEETIRAIKQKSEEVRKEIEKAADDYKKRTDELLATVQAKADEVNKKMDKAAAE